MAERSYSLAVEYIGTRELMGEYRVIEVKQSVLATPEKAQIS